MACSFAGLNCSGVAIARICVHVGLETPYDGEGRHRCVGNGSKLLGAVMRPGRLDGDDMGEHFEKLPDDIIHHVPVVIDSRR